jgi:4-hydroxy-tetrahydrodipicolinate synthase
MAAAAAFSVEGVYTALATPFLPGEGGGVDFESLARLVAAQVAAGVAGVVACGTTGESPTLSKEEKKAVIARVVELCKGSAVRVVAGTGSNNTAESVELTRFALGAGADACLVVNPYYNRPSQAGLVAHVCAVAAVGLPVILYNIPGRSGVNMNVATVAEIVRACPPGGRIAALKDATGGVDQAAELALAVPGLCVMSGDDGITLPFMSVGARGVVSVLSNLAPRALVEMVRLALANDFAAARRLHERTLPLAKALFCETNPTPLKFALARVGLFAGADVRLPLVAIAAESEAKVAAAMDRAKADGLVLG